MIVETSRTLLRPVDRRDVDELHVLDGDPLVMRYVSDGAPTPRSTIEDWVLPRAQAELITGRGGMFAVIDRRYGAFLGWMSLRAPRHSSRSEMELTYRFRRDSWGRGLATEAARAVTDLAFAELRTERLFASTTATNTPSRRVMEKLGMRMSGVHLSDERPFHGFGEVEYELLRIHWENGHRAPHQWDTGTPRWPAAADRSTDLTA